MAFIKRPIRTVLFYLSSFVGLVFVLIIGLFLKNSQYNLSQLENKAKKLFAVGSISLVSLAKADIPSNNNGGGGGDSIGDDGGGDGGGSGDGSGSGDGDGSGEGEG